MFTGSFVALVTPFRDSKIDEKAFAALIEMHVAAGTDGIIPCGTTGESATLSFDEHQHLIRLAVKYTRKRMKVIAGTGSNSTAEAIFLSKAAEKDGADGCLVVTPYYNKPTQKGLIQYFKEVAESVSIPIIAYNVPGRTGVNIMPKTLLEISRNKNICAVKEASGDLVQMSEIAALMDKDFSILSGDDMLLLPGLSIGARGVISVVANILPKETKELITAYQARDTEAALKIHRNMFPVMKAMFMETNPIPVKAAMALLGWIQPEIRSPLTELEAENLASLKNILRDFGLKV
ncbi:MAG: 4-hydroxy-tetrahydrodipicolinate synthase [Pseudomonadota bacterium]